ncbi:hypothetical protein PROFUN_15932 [Planoprotostelium fungivorum]|uniref:RING-Gid-type domain-containing protein n=1 Tax=Planoprotostelium fungivorum TaxID=1890364 RepID=A0A2P6MTY1_9EUKA|nr:hypothetical protein PROFUN_15932 [Planoprotostelium fungivorum]
MASEGFGSKLAELNAPMERMIKKQKTCYQKNTSSIDNILQQIEQAKKNLDTDNMQVEGSDESSLISETLSNLHKQITKSNPSAAVVNEHKEYYSTISKFGKSVEKLFPSDITAAMDPNIKFPRDLLNNLLSEHLLREGKFELANLFSTESGIEVDRDQMAQFEEVHDIMRDIQKNRDLSSITRWSIEKRPQLLSLDTLGETIEPEGGSSGRETKSHLEFKISRLQFVQLVQNNPEQAVQFARENFSAFFRTHLKEIQKLMGCLIFAGRLDHCPYSSYFVDSSSSLWSEIAEDFLDSSCRLMGLSRQSPLFLSLAAGSIALPKQLKVAGLTRLKSLKVQPLELDLGPSFQFHSIFACPVSREQTTSDNPPMRLICGHVISKMSLQKLVKSGGRLKCPYCPTETSPSKALQIHF